jgi:hypothetical protein
MRILLTVFLKRALIAMAANNALTLSLSLSNPVLEGYQPAVFLGLGDGLESMLVAVEHEGKVVKVTLPYIADIGLPCKFHVSYRGSGWHAGPTNQVEDALRVFLILRSLSEEEKTLSGLGGMCSICMTDVLRLLIAQVCREMLVFKGRVAEPEILFREDKAPKKRERYISILLSA